MNKIDFAYFMEEYLEEAVNARNGQTPIERVAAAQAKMAKKAPHPRPGTRDVSSNEPAMRALFKVGKILRNAHQSVVVGGRPAKEKDFSQKYQGYD